ncbi:putative iron-regulated protein (plasmid) [Piscirickettsia salmonis]|uniref:2OG-Fe(II) oxygenase n=1 Tax=Piscirickettsia salmonis TaxID=1238 RepID=UPI0012B74274|nr:2OG-Fe(II) oxygenase [Piscirickettsia salmonis]QGP52489.1 putative iron-regulated protein [Piscirickettsia salmonis]
MIKHKENLQLNDHILMNKRNSPFLLSDFMAIDELIDSVGLEGVVAGDAGDEHKLTVARFRRDIDLPVDLDPSSKDLMKIINSDKMQKFYRELTGFNGVCIRRAQANILRKGDYVGIHIDGVGDPKYQGSHIDYKYAVVLHFGLDYTGGDTVIYPKSGAKNIRLPEYSMFIITGALPHEVEVVESGIRKTLVYFLSDNFGQSKK